LQSPLFFGRLPGTVSDKISQPVLLVTAAAVADDDPAALLGRIDDQLRELGNPRIVKATAFVDANLLEDDSLRRGVLSRDADWPVTVVGQEACFGCGLGGIQVWAVKRGEVETLKMDNRVVGTVFGDEHARTCLLGGLEPASAGSPGEQAVHVFEAMEKALALADMDFSHVIRTWFHLNDILSWYDAFNEARDSFFTPRGVFGRLVPASTGIGGSNAAGSALSGDLLAVKPLDDRVQLLDVASPLQPEATAYGSSFSRAVELDRPDQRQLFISGTASIDREGHTAHPGDPEKQVALTMDVVRAILESRDMPWANVTRATAYFKRAEDAPAFLRYRADKGLADLPVLMVENDVCREDLLFEIEVDAGRGSV